MSIGLLRDQLVDNLLFSAFIVSADSSASGMSMSPARSAAIAPGPPPLVTIASRYPEAADCRLDLLSMHGGRVALSSSVSVETSVLPDTLASYAAVILPGFFALDIEHLAMLLRTVWPPVIERLRALPAETLVSASCYGTFVLAESGLLDGMEATTTWWKEAEFRTRYPAIRLDADRALVDGGRCLTAGAMTAHTDLTLHVLRRLYGAELARKVAGIMLVDGARTSQRPFMALPRSFADSLVQQAADWLAAHSEEPLSAQVLAAAQNGIDFQIDETILQNNIANLAGKVEAVSNILPFLLECQNEIEASEHIRRLAQRLTIDEGLIAEEYRKAARRGGRQQTGQPTVIPEEKSAGIGQQAEELLLRLLLEQPQLCDECCAEVKETGFEDAVLAQLFDRLCELGTAYTTDKLNNVLDDAAQTALARILAHQLPEGDMDKLMQDCFRQMRRLRLEKEYEKHRLLADEYERSADERFLSELMESQRIKNEKNMSKM